MISDFTREQLAKLEVAPNRPLLICDVDEVVVHFTRAFEAYLSRRDLWLDLASFSLNGNIRHKVSGAAIEAEQVADLVDDFFVVETEHLETIDGSVDALNQLSRHASVVMLTNLPHHARDKRVSNLLGHGLTFPVVTNSGPKGPAITHLAALTSAPVVFVDDSPNFIRSAWDHAPHVHLVHFLHDERYARHIEPFDFVSLRTDSWTHAHPHIAALVSG